MVDALKRAQRAPHHRRDPVLRLCAPGPPPALDACADLAPRWWPTCSRRWASSRVLTMDLHADQIQGFFDIPVDNIYASPVLLARPARARTTTTWSWSRPTSAAWCAPARWPSSSSCDLAIIDKRRPTANVCEVMHVIGEIEGRNCVIMDDMIDTAGTLVKAAEVLKERGAKQRLRLLHAPGVLGPGDRAHRQARPARRGGDHQHDSADRRGAQACKKIRQLSVAFLFAETIRRISDGESVTSAVRGAEQ